MHVFIGIDPGVSGGIALIDELGLVLRVVKMPPTERDILDALALPQVQCYREEQDVVEFQRAPARAVLERVNAGVFTQGQRMGVVSAFTFGRGVGRLEMALTAAGVPFDMVLPVHWQTVLGCLSKGDKNVTKRRAQQLFPTTKVTHAIADALLLAEYCRRLWHGVPRTKEQRRGQEETGGEARQEEARDEGSQDLEAFVRHGQAAQQAADTAIADAAGPGAGAQHAPRRAVRRRG